MGALLERFYDAKEGSIKLDGCDIKSLDTKWLRGSYLGYIGQVTFNAQCVRFKSSVEHADVKCQ